MAKFKKNYKPDVNTYEQDKGFGVDDNGNLINSDEGNIEIVKDPIEQEDNNLNIEIDFEVPEERYDEETLRNNNSTITNNSTINTLSVQETMNDILGEYTDALKDQSAFLEGSPTFVTYYKINNGHTTEDTGLGGVVELIGVESPVKYDKIIGFPIWNMGELTANYSYDEFQGLDTEIEIDGIILPETIKPRVEEMIVLSFRNKTYLFTLTDIQPTNVLNQCYYRITLSLIKYDIDYLNSQVIHTYRFNFEDKCFIEKDAEEANQLLNDLLARLMRSYVSNFYVEKFNSFLYDNLYDKYLHRFIHHNHVFVKKKTFMFNIHVEPTLRFTISDETKYMNTIYERVSSCRNEEFIDKVDFIPIMDRGYSNVFQFYRDPVREIDHSSIHGVKSIINENLLNPCYNECLMLSSERIIRRYILTKSLDYNDYLEDLDNLVIEYYLKDYIQYPLVIFILKEILKDNAKKIKISLIDKYNDKKLN